MLVAAVFTYAWLGGMLSVRVAARCIRKGLQCVPQLRGRGRPRSSVDERAYFGRTVASGLDADGCEQSTCRGTVVSFKAAKYTIQYNDGTSAKLTVTQLKELLLPVTEGTLIVVPAIEATTHAKQQATETTDSKLAESSAGAQEFAAQQTAASTALQSPTTAGTIGQDDESGAQPSQSKPRKRKKTACDIEQTEESEKEQKKFEWRQALKMPVGWLQKVYECASQPSGIRTACYMSPDGTRHNSKAAAIAAMATMLIEQNPSILDPLPAEPEEQTKAVQSDENAADAQVVGASAEASVDPEDEKSLELSRLGRFTKKMKQFEDSQEDQEAPYEDAD